MCGCVFIWVLDSVKIADCSHSTVGRVSALPTQLAWCSVNVQDCWIQNQTVMFAVDEVGWMIGNLLSITTSCSPFVVESSLLITIYVI